MIINLIIIIIHFYLKVSVVLALMVLTPTVSGLYNLFYFYL